MLHTVRGLQKQMSHMTLALLVVCLFYKGIHVCVCVCVCVCIYNTLRVLQKQISQVMRDPEMLTYADVCTVQKANIADDARPRVAREPRIYVYIQYIYLYILYMYMYIIYMYMCVCVCVCLCVRVCICV